MSASPKTALARQDANAEDYISRAIERSYDDPEEQS